MLNNTRLIRLSTCKLFLYIHFLLFFLVYLDKGKLPPTCNVSDDDLCRVMIGSLDRLVANELLYIFQDLLLDGGLPCFRDG